MSHLIFDNSYCLCLRLLLLFLILFTMFRIMLVNVTLLLLQFEKCIVDDICDAGRQAGSSFFSLSPGGVHKQKGW